MLLLVGLIAMAAVAALLLLRDRRQRALGEERHRRRAAYRAWRWEHFVWRKRHKRLPDLRADRPRADRHP